MTQTSETPRRIPIGTRVKWQTDPGYGRVWDGIVVGFESAFLHYVVEVDKTPTGKPAKTIRTMRPWAKRLEAQNPKALK